MFRHWELCFLLSIELHCALLNTLNEFLLIPVTIFRCHRLNRDKSNKILIEFSVLPLGRISIAVD